MEFRSRDSEDIPGEFHRLVELADAAILRGDREAAVRYLRLAAQAAGDSPGSLVRAAQGFARIDEFAEAESRYRNVLSLHALNFDALVGLVALSAKPSTAIGDQDVEAWLEDLTATIDATARQRYSLAALLFTMGRYQHAWQQTWAALHSRSLDKDVRASVQELQRILRQEYGGPESGEEESLHER